MQPGPAWKVIQVQDATGPDGTGNFVKGRNVTYQLVSGGTGTVFVPGTQTGSPTPDQVRAAIAAEADNHNAILNLTSDTPPAALNQ